MITLRAILRRRWVKWSLALIVSVPVIVFMVFWACVWVLPYPSALSRTLPNSTWITDRKGDAIAACVATDDQWRLPLAEGEINPHLQNSIVAVEDSRFFSHGGVDWKSVLGSAWENGFAFRTRRGASTLSMQLVRLRSPSARNLLNKFIQAVRATQLESKLDKNGILLSYLNEAPFGGNLVGAGAASWRYFGKPCNQLSLAECALLAGLPQNPNRLRPDLHPERALARRNHVLNRMHALQMIDDAAYAEALREPLNATWRPLPQMKDDGSLPTLLRLVELYRGQRVVLSLDSSIQRTAHNLAKEHLARLASSRVSAAAVVVLDTSNSQVLSVVSQGDSKSKVDLTAARRSSGSTLKPFIYAAAIDAGMLSMSSVLDDQSQSWTGYTPANFDRNFKGQLTAAEALAESRNIPAMVVLARVGVARTVNTLGACGIRSITYNPQRYGLPLAIGGAEVSPLELAEAYATVARGGVHRDVSFILNRFASDQHNSVFSQDACNQVLTAISESHRTERISPDAARLGVAWKTGTSSGHRDAWCAAVTPRFTVVVWLGNADGKGSNVLVGTDAAAPLALELISTIDSGGPGFEKAAGSDRALAAHPIERAKLAIISPVNGDQLILDSATTTQVSLQANSNQSGQELFWFVDGSAVTGDRWTPTPGSHEIRVTNTEGTTAISRVVVRAE